ncbi:zinc-binding dehydrogenase [Planctomycetota bacterium]
MKTVLLTALKEMELSDIPEPKIEKDTDVLLKVEATGVCGSDVHYYETGRIGSQIVDYPFAVGHECSATVQAVGDNVTKVKIGEPVVVEPSIACQSCDQCLQGREHTCRNVRFLGTPGQTDGCLCEYIVVPEQNCYPTYGDISFEQGALCEPLSIGVYTIKRAGFNEGEKIAILGTGPIGLCVLLAAKLQNPGGIFLTDKIDTRLQTAQKLGATWSGNPDKTDIVNEILSAKPTGLDVVYECCGQQDALDQAIEILKPGGKLVIVGIPRDERIFFSSDSFRRKELTVTYIRRQNHCTQAAIESIRSGQIDVDFLVTHRFGLEETKTAFDLVAGYQDGVIKAMINI